MNKNFTTTVTFLLLSAFAFLPLASAQDLSVEGNLTIESLSGTGTRMATVLPDGTIGQQAIGNSSISDADGDTQIQCEESPNEDIIRFDLGGTELMRLENATLHIGNPFGAVFIGNNAGMIDNSSWANTFVGNRAGEGNEFGYANTGIGNMVFSLPNNMGSENVAVGDATLSLLQTGHQNTALGNRAMTANVGGMNNVAAGYEALVTCNSDGNTGLGHRAGQLVQNSTNCTFVGVAADISGGAIPPLNNSTALGASTTIDADNQVRVGNAAVMSIGGFQAWTNLSDGRFKRKVEKNVPGLEFVLQLQPVTYNLDVDGLAEHLNEDVVYTNGSRTKTKPDEATAKSRKEKEKIRFSGFIAQDVEAAAQKAGYDFSGVDKPRNEQGLYGLRYAEFTVPLVKAVQELNEKNEKLRVGSDALSVRSGELEAENKRQAGQIEKLQSTIQRQEERLQRLEALLAGQAAPKTQTDAKVYKGFEKEFPQLFQNRPNPTGNTTLIGYHLPEGAKNAELRIATLDGKPVKTYALTQIGQGSITVESGQLSAGTYIYSLVIDNTVLDSKQMVVLK